MIADVIPSWWLNSVDPILAFVLGFVAGALYVIVRWGDPRGPRSGGKSDRADS